MTTVKEESNTDKSHSTLTPTAKHHRDDVFNDIEPSTAELLISNAELWQQEDLSSLPSLSTTKLSTWTNVNVGLGATVENMFSVESSPIPVFCVENRASKDTYSDLRRKPMSPSEQVSCNENCLKKKPHRVLQPSEREEMSLDQSLDVYIVSENDDADTNNVNSKPLCSNTLSPGGIINEDSPLDDTTTMKDFEILHQEQNQSSDVLSGTNITNVDMNAMHCTRMDERDCTDVKTEYSDELVPELSERVVGHLDIKTKYSDELVPKQSERLVGHLDIKTENSDELDPKQSERLVGHLDIKTENSDVLVPEQSERLVGHLDIKTENSDVLDPKQSERLVGHLDIKTENSDVLVPEQSERLVGHLDIKTENSDELVPGQSERLVGHLDIKTENSDELVPEQSERLVGLLDIKTKNSDELVMEQSEGLVGHLDIKTENSDVLDPKQSERLVGHLDIKTENSDVLDPKQSERLVGHLDIKTENCDELVPEQSESVAGHLDTVIYGDKNCDKMEHSMKTDCDSGDAFNIEQMGSFTCSICSRHYVSCRCLDVKRHIVEQHTKPIYALAQVEFAFSQHLSTCEEPELDEKTFSGESYAKDLGISIQQHGTESRQTECRKVEDVQTLSVKDVHACPLCKLAFPSNQYLESHMKRRHTEKHWRDIKESMLKKSSAVGFNCCEDEDHTFSKSVDYCTNEERGIETVEQVVNNYLIKSESLEQSVMCKEEESFKSNGSGQNASQIINLCSNVTHKGEGSVEMECSECRQMCGKTFSHSCDLHSHMKTHTGEKPFKSNGSGQNASQIINLCSNVTHKGEGSVEVECSECRHMFSQESDHCKNMKKVKEKQVLKCNEHSSFSNQSNFHFDKDMNIEQPLTHNECCNILSQYNCLQGQMRTHTGEKRFKCNECAKMFNYKGDLNKHMRTHTGERPFKCNVCTNTFRRSGTLHNHMRTHTGEKPFKCNKCGKTFSQSGNFRYHMRTHTREKPFKCNECGKTFTRSGHLHHHIRTHTGEKPFKCNECGKTFSWSEDLHSHMRTHRGGKLFKCNECGKTFILSDNLHSHMRTHRGEKPFKCNECGKMFNFKGDLHKHIRTHTGEKPFKCNVCGNTFSRSGILHNHMRTHSDEKPFKCNECDKTFSQSDNLHSHMTTHTEKKSHSNVMSVKGRLFRMLKSRFT